MERNQPEHPLWTFRLTSGLMARLIPLTLVLFVASIAVYLLLASQALAAAPFSVPALVLTIPLVLVVHEALHGAGFIVFGGRPKFGAGIKGAMPYFFATCPGTRFTWGQTLIIGALPLVGIDFVALALAGYTPLAVPAMLAFAINNAGAVGDLWLMGVILQTPRTALFEDTDGPAMVAWPGPGTSTPARSPRGLDPRGYESVVMWSTVGLGIFLAAYVAIGIIEVVLARASANGTLALGNLELARDITSNGHLSTQVSFLPSVVMAAGFAAVLTWATHALVRGRNAGHAARRPPEDDA